jgi:hypothetical protein
VREDDQNILRSPGVGFQVSGCSCRLSVSKGARYRLRTGQDKRFVAVSLSDFRFFPQSSTALVTITALIYVAMPQTSQGWNP